MGFGGLELLRTEELEYELPPELIATRAVEPRDSARMLVVSRTDPARLEDRLVRDLPELLAQDDLLVFNTTRVIPARFVGHRVDTRGAIEGLYLRDGVGPGPGGSKLWVAMLRGRHLHERVRVALHDEQGHESGVELELLEKVPDEPGAWVTKLTDRKNLAGSRGSEGILERVGSTPLPPYILKMRRSTGLTVDEREDRERYQTVYAVNGSSSGGAGGGGVATAEAVETVHGSSVAAPTAGMHFTPGLLKALEARGVKQAEARLHVGTGTFKPVATDVVEEHEMHSEWCTLPAAAREAIGQARRLGKRVMCVGTTSARTVESYAALAESGRDVPEWLSTRLLITPGYKWKWMDGMMTNFHLPRTTLLAMVASLFEPGVGPVPRGPVRGVERVKQIYAHAVKERYRFYSFGDSMLILP